MTEWLTSADKHYILSVLTELAVETGIDIDGDNVMLMDNEGTCDEYFVNIKAVKTSNDREDGHDILIVDNWQNADWFTRKLFPWNVVLPEEIIQFYPKTKRMDARAFLMSFMNRGFDEVF